MKKPGVMVVEIQHEKHCRFLKTKGKKACNCNPKANMHPDAMAYFRKHGGGNE